MTRIISAFTAIVLLSPTFGADPLLAPAPTFTLKAEELAAGWVTLFDGVTTYGLNTRASVVVKDNTLSLTKELDDTQVMLLGLPKDLEFSCEIMVTGQIAEVDLCLDKIYHLRVPATDWTSLSFVHDSLKPNSMVAQLGKKEMTDVVTGKAVAATQNTFISINPFGQKTAVQLRNMKMRPLHTKALVEKNDMSQWKVFPGEKYKSKFTVNDNGEIAVKNGPGDLQTVAKYADFCLQMECKTNGPALNSGIFFRCLPDQYQQGYEAQIQNAVVNNDANRPLDFGTGAIYRRQPARRVMAKDNEWFHMTVLAKGKRLRTWVNGYPAVDWTDTRPEAANARQGLYTKEGHLSIQGHDPTTDILFRKLAIVNLASN